jgi:hypothetical protein
MHSGTAQHTQRKNNKRIFHFFNVSIFFLVLNVFLKRVNSATVQALRPKQPPYRGACVMQTKGMAPYS